jgi:hypothetical protein
LKKIKNPKKNILKSLISVSDPDTGCTFAQTTFGS